MLLSFVSSVDLIVLYQRHLRPDEVIGINSRAELARADAVMQGCRVRTDLTSMRSKHSVGLGADDVRLGP